MKKITVLLIAFSMLLSLAACGGKDESEGSSFSEGAVFSAENETENIQDTPADTDISVAGETGSGSSNSEGENDTEEHRSLVAYFSATGTTKGVAESLAEGAGADLYEILPEESYTDDDLDYHDDNSRSTMEMNDPSSRPKISGSVDHMEQYEVVFIGYPIWWGEAPRIVSTFMESYDFSGKTIVPFCTSGGSGMGSSAANLEKLTSNAEWLSGRRFDGGSTSAEMAEWVGSLGL